MPPIDMRVLLINTNRERSPETPVPLGLCCVASAAHEAGHLVRVLDLCFEHNPARVTAGCVRNFQPDVIGVSVRNLDNCDYARPRGFLPEVSRIADVCRSVSDAPIVLGGPAVSQAPGVVARFLGCELAVGGEGEAAFPALLRAMEAGSDPAAVPGVAVDGAAPGSVHLLDEPALAALPDPDPARWLDLRPYRACGAPMPIQTKRGCALHCSYCAYPQIEGPYWRLREPGWAAEQVIAASKAGMRSVEIVDSVFGIPQEHAVACCEAIARTPRPHLTTLDLNPLCCTPEVIDAMDAAGFSAVGVTADSGSDAMLRSLDKGFDSDDLRRAARYLRRLKACRLWVFMLGAPGETEATVRETARFIEELPRTDLVIVTCGIRVLPGTALREALVADGVIGADDDLIRPSFYHSPHVSPERAWEILGQCSFPANNMVTLADGGHKLLPVVQRLATMLGVRPPYWRYLPLLNRARRVLRV